MKITTKGRYALRMLLDLGAVTDDRFTSLKVISERENISKKYLEQITPVLLQAGMLDTNRGPQGGYRLIMDPEKITVAEVLRLTEGSLSFVECEGSEDCPRLDGCRTAPVWTGLTRVVTDYLESITLAQLLRRDEIKTDVAQAARLFL